MGNIGNELRQAGMDIGNAIEGPAELRFKLKMMKQKEEELDQERSFRRDELRSKQDDREFDQDYKNRLLEIQQQNADTARYKAKNQNRASTAAERAANQFTFFQNVDSQLTDFNAKNAEKIAQKMAAGDKEGAVADMDAANQQLEIVQKKLMPQLASLKYDTENSAAAKIVDNVQRKTEELDTTQYEAVSEAVDEVITKKLGMSFGTLDQIRSYSEKAGTDNPYKGYKIGSEVKMEMVKPWANKELTLDEIKKITGGSEDQTLDEYKDYLETILKGETSKAQKRLALNIYEQITAAETLGVDMPEKLTPMMQKLGDKDLLELSEKGASSSLRNVAKKERKSRQKKEPAKPFKLPTTSKVFR